MKLLIIRFSALGDVAMTVPVIDSLARRYPELEITVLTRDGFGALFRRLPANVRPLGIDLKNYKGLAGLNKLYKELREENYTHVADLHDVLRTKYLRTRFRLAGRRVAVIDKGRNDKKKLTRRRNKIFEPLTTGFARYHKALSDLGFRFDLDFKSIYANGKADISNLRRLTGEKGTDKWMGIAPFAKHQGKIYPLELQERVIDHFHRRKNVKVFMFGGGKQEKDTVQVWKEKFPGIISVVGELGMEQELALMSHMDIFLSMDSGNMHLASLVGVPVVSVWGATHPFAGFMAWGQPSGNVLQAENLSCRPCSVFGQKPCYRGDYACLYGIKPERIISEMELL